MDIRLFFSMCLDQVLEVVIKVLEDNILNEFSTLVLGVKEVLYLDYVWASLQHAQDLVLSAHAFTHFLYPF